MQDIEIRARSFEDGHLLFDLILSEEEIAACSAATGRGPAVTGMGPRFVASGNYFAEDGRLAVDTPWTAYAPGGDAVTDFLRPKVLPVIEAELARMYEAGGRHLVREAAARGWVVLRNPSPALKDLFDRAEAGDAEATAAMDRISPPADDRRAASTAELSDAEMASIRAAKMPAEHDWDHEEDPEIGSP